MSHPPVDDEYFVVIFLDLTKVHPHCATRRQNVYIQLPPEAGAAEDECGLCHKTLYGLRDANQALEFAIKDGFEQCDFIQ